MWCAWAVIRGSRALKVAADVREQGVAQAGHVDGCHGGSWSRSAFVASLQHGVVLESVSSAAA